MRVELTAGVPLAHELTPEGRRALRETQETFGRVTTALVFLGLCIVLAAVVISRGREAKQ